MRLWIRPFTRREMYLQTKGIIFIYYVYAIDINCTCGSNVFHPNPYFNLAIYISSCFNIRLDEIKLKVPNKWMETFRNISHNWYRLFLYSLFNCSRFLPSLNSFFLDLEDNIIDYDCKSRSTIIANLARIIELSLLVIHFFI